MRAGGERGGGGAGGGEEAVARGERVRGWVGSYGSEKK